MIVSLYTKLSLILIIGLGFITMGDLPDTSGIVTLTVLVSVGDVHLPIKKAVNKTTIPIIIYFILLFIT